MSNKDAKADAIPHILLSLIEFSSRFLHLCKFPLPLPPSFIFKHSKVKLIFKTKGYTLIDQEGFGGNYLFIQVWCHILSFPVAPCLVEENKKGSGDLTKGTTGNYVIDPHQRILKTTPPGDYFD